MKKEEVRVEVKISIPPLYFSVRKNERKYKSFIELYLKKHYPDLIPKRIKGEYIICERILRKR